MTVGFQKIKLTVIILVKGTLSLQSCVSQILKILSTKFIGMEILMNKKQDLEISNKIIEEYAGESFPSDFAKLYAHHSRL